jgi:hypothetical protein
MKFLQVSLVIFVGIALLMAGCVEATPGEGGSDTPFWVKETTPPVGTPTTTTTLNSEYVSPATPYPATTTPAIIPSTRQVPENTQDKPAYPEVLYETIDLNGEGHAWTINTLYPPLIVDLAVTPEMEKRTLVYQSSYGDRDEETSTVTRISPNSNLEVTIRDADGNIVAQDGFNGKYTVGTSKRLIVLKSGIYQVDLRGTAVIADISIKIGKIEGENAVST